MSRQVFILANEHVRQKALRCVNEAPAGYVVEVREQTRSHEQNNLMWTLLTAVAAQNTHHGLHLTENDWKLLFMDALHREVRIVPNLEGDGMVPLSSSRQLTKGQMSDLVEIIHAWCAREGVVLDAAPIKTEQR